MRLLALVLLLAVAGCSEPIAAESDPKWPILSRHDTTSDTIWTEHDSLLGVCGD